MALLSAVVLPSKEIVGGKNKVRIAIAHNGETRYIVTDIILDSSKEFKNGVVVKRPDATLLNTRIRGIMQRLQSTLDELEYVDGLTCPELVFQLKNAKLRKQRTFESVFEEYMQNAHIKSSTATNYYWFWKTCAGFFGGKTLVNNFNRDSVINLDNYLRKKGYSQPTITIQMTFIKVLLAYARRCGYLQNHIDPFFGYKMPSSAVRDSWLSVEQIRRIRDFYSNKKNIIKARDLFMLSYYLGGINVADLLNINFNEQKDVIHYARKKTEDCSKVNKYVEFDIPYEAKVIIDKYRGNDGFLIVTKNQRKYAMSSFFHNNLGIIAKATGIRNLIYYSARKSFSQHAFNLGISTSVIDYILGHSIGKGGSSLYHYIYVTPELATEAVRKVLDNLK